MKRCLLFLVLLFSVVLGTQAQTLQRANVMQLVTANTEAIGITKEQAGNLKLSAAYAYQGTQYVYLVQTYQGLPVYNQMLVLAFKDNKLVSHAGKLLNVGSDRALLGSSSPTPSLSAANAITSAFLAARVAAPTSSAPINSGEGSTVLNFGKLAGVSENVTAELMWVPVEKTQTTKLVWQVQVVPAGKSDWWMMQIDASSGALINKVNLTVSDNFGGSGLGILARPNQKPTTTEFGGDAQGTNPPSVTTGNYRVVPFPYESPTHHAFAVVTNPWLDAGLGNAATTDGWHFDGTTNYSITRGNNVYAYLDVDNNNTPNPTGNNFPEQSTTPDPSLTFTPVFDGTTDPSTTINKNAALTSLFYWNNIIHDITYQYGFTEAAANFQTDNLGRGGVGNDYVQAEAQDGGGTNNANFATPADGGRPRMQMYLWDAVSTIILKVNTPAAIAGNYPSVESGFSTANKLAAVGPITAQAVLFNDATGGTHDACSGPPSNSLTGKIALIYRNVCGFTVKVKEAQNAGAKAVIMINNVAGAPIVMGGTDNTITIPALMVSDVNGALLVSQIANNENITMSATSGQRLDGDLDAGIMVHEYGHGVSNRFTGGGTAGCLGNAEQGGEGWSDYGALMLTTNWATATINDGPNPRPMGVYVFGQPVTGAGIRTYPYSTNMAVNPWTYAGVQTTGGEVHIIGEIWCATIWDMTWNIIQQEGLINTNLYSYTGVGGNSIALKLVYEGMKLQPCNPGFLDARDAILRADQNLFAGKHTCAIWTAFARRGMGFSATQGLSTSTNDQVQAFDLPPAVIYTTQPASTSVCVGSTATFTAVATPGSPTTFQWQVSTDGGNTWVNISGASTTTYTTAATVAADNGKKYRLVGTTACGTTISNVATLTVITASVGGTLAPAAASACGVSSYSGTITLSGQSGNIIRWESSTDGGATWVNIANTTTTLNYTASVTTMFRALIQGGGCATAVYSTTATFTMMSGQPLSIVPDPGATLCAGDPTRLTVNESTGATTTVTMTNSITTAASLITINFRNTNAFAVKLTDISSMLNYTGGVANVAVYYKTSAVNGAPGAISTANGWNTLGTNSFPSVGGVVTPFLSGLNLVIPAGTTYGIAVSATNTLGGNANLIFSSANTQATATNGGCTITSGTNVSYVATTPAPTAPTFTPYYFIGSITVAPLTPVTTGTYTWSPAAGLSSTVGNPVAASPATTTTYSVSNDNGAGCVRTASILITVNQRPAITVQPSPSTTCVGSAATFSVTATGTGLTYQWQQSTDNCTTYTNIATGTSATLTLPNVTAAMSGNGYRCVVSGACTPALTTNCVKLTVNAIPALSITPSGLVCGGVPGINGVALTTGGPAGPPPIPGTATFTSTTSVPVPDGVASGATSAITVAGIPANATVTNVTVTLNMSHTYPGDMTFNLKGANGVIANLYKHNNDQATGAASGPATWGWYGAQVSGTTGTAPFTSVTGTYIYGTTPIFKPDLFNGLGTSYPISDPTGYTATATSMSQLYLPGGTTTINGPWTLAMADGGAGDVGTLAGWAIKIDYTTPDPNGAPITYVWSPAAGLYTNTIATLPYATGTQTPTVYAAPATVTTYTVTATTAATGCTNSAQVVVNYTPPAPVVTPNPATICLGTSVKLKSTGINATPATWSPVTSLYSDAATATPYVAGTAVDSVWAKPIVTTTYNATVQTAATGAGNTVAMTNTLSNVAQGVSINFRNNNPYPVNIKTISGLTNFAGAAIVSAYYKPGAISGNPGAITTANGWIKIDTTTLLPAPPQQTLTQFIGNINGVTVAANSTIGMMIYSTNSTNGNNVVFSNTGTNLIASTGGCDIITGAGVTFVGALAPAAPTTPGVQYYFIGSIGFTPVIAPCTSAPTAVVVNVNTPVVITTQPTAAAVCTDKVVSFTAAATGSAITHNWRVQTVTGGAWADVANGGVYAGAKTGTLTITAPPVSMSGYSYKDSVSTTPCAAAVSNAVKLTVNPLPTINLTVAPYKKLFPGLTTTITAAVTPAAATYTWLKNGVAVANATSSSTVVDVNNLGDYSLRVTDVNGCTSTSGIVSITDSASGKFFIYPNPNSGQFQVRYYSVANNTNLVRGINVYDARGKRVLVQSYNISTPFARMDVDLRSFGSGVYWLELVDLAGNRLAVGRAEVLR